MKKKQVKGYAALVIVQSPWQSDRSYVFPTHEDAIVFVRGVISVSCIAQVTFYPPSIRLTEKPRIRKKRQAF